MGGFVPGVGSMVLASPDGTAETVARQWTTAGFFDALGVAPETAQLFGETAFWALQSIRGAPPFARSFYYLQVFGRLAPQTSESAARAELALVLAMVGLFGMLAYGVQIETRNFGVRRALGASSGQVLGLVMKRAVGVTVVGLGIGLALSMFVGRVLATLVVLTAAVSRLGPAWRAMRIEPARALRND